VERVVEALNIRKSSVVLKAHSDWATDDSSLFRMAELLRLSAPSLPVQHKLAAHDKPCISNNLRVSPSLTIFCSQRRRPLVR